MVWTGIIIGYVLMMMFSSPSNIDKVHDVVPPFAYASAFLDTWDAPEWNLRSNESQEKVASTLALFRRANDKDDELDVVNFDEEESSINLYSPHYTFLWQVEPWLVSFVVNYEHKQNNERISTNLLPMIMDSGVWEWELWLDTDFMKAWTNTYTFEATTESWDKKTYKKKIIVDFEEIQLGKTTLYIDPYFKQEGANLVWTEDDFDWLSTSFLNAWCVDNDDKVIIKYNNVLSSIPACLSYSPQKWYLMYFDNKKELDWRITYTALSPEHGLIYRNFPLYQRRRWSLYQSLMFFNPEGQFVQIVKATGDVKNYETLIQHFDIRSQRNTMSLRQINGEQIEIENGSEKVILYYYKNNQSRRNVVYPGLRFKYYTWRSGSWRLVNQWTVYHLDEQVRIPPVEETWSVFRIDAHVFNNEVIVEDPFMHITYAIPSLWKATSIVQKPEKLFECDDVTLQVYGYNADKREYLYKNDDITLLWEWRSVDTLILEDSHGSTYQVDQHTLGYVATTISPLEKWEASWKTTFTLTGLDEKGKEICKKTTTLDIIEAPVY